MGFTVSTAAAWSALDEGGRSFTFDAGDLVAGDAPKDVWLESKHSKLPPFVALKTSLTLCR